MEYIQYLCNSEHNEGLVYACELKENYYSPGFYYAPIKDVSDLSLFDEYQCQCISFNKENQTTSLFEITFKCSKNENGLYVLKSSVFNEAIELTEDENQPIRNYTGENVNEYTKKPFKSFSISREGLKILDELCISEHFVMFGYLVTKRQN